MDNNVDFTFSFLRRVAENVYVKGNLSIGVSKTKFSGNKSAALAIKLRYD